MKTIDELGISPTPWKIKDTPVTLNSCCDGYEGGSMEIRSLSTTIADLTCDLFYDQFKEEITANARLIAAAPKLYEALEECERKLDAIEPYGNLLQKVRFALAEASGEKVK